MNYKEIIESRYNRQNWQLLLRDIFGSKIKFWSTPSIVATSSAFAKQALWLGTITLSDEQTIAVYEVELADSVDIERNRRGIRDMLLTTWRNNGNAGAFMFCYRKSESVLRFSYVSEAWKFAEDGSYQKEATDARRFTYLLGEGHRSRTAIQQFEKLRDSGLSLKDLTKAFSVDAVSDMFFDGYKKQYEDIIFYITGKRMVKVANKWEERLEGKPCQHIMQQFSCFPNPEKAIRDYVKKLMGRLVFLQFLQKKGWLGVGIHDEWGSGDSEFIQNLFAHCNDKDHFIDKVLEPLFDDLNSENEKKLPQYRTPYLNGGLFEQDATDDTDFSLPEKYMKSLLDFFASYNFTIDENDPDDAEVGVDPEMLGRIFENLLEDNKDKGAFYTPKEIVSYMCRESLIAYLQTGIEDETTKEAIRQFVTTHQVQEHLPKNTDQLLKDVKICDPAIGSGAFPMGLLKELFLCRTALEGISQHQAAEIKKHIIQQNVYGVDIERGAVDIARLRFWLSLIVDEETPQALPNLDFKIMQGNSLLEQYKGVDLSTMTEKKADDTGMLTFFDDMIDVCRKELRDMLIQYFDCTDHIEKQSLRIRIIENVKQQLRDQHINVDFGDLDLSGNDQFFLWHTWFHDVFSKGGFDIVIGNPPYIQLQADSGKLGNLYKNCGFETFTRTGDIYSLFYEQGWNLLNMGGHLCFITSNKWMRAGYGESTREFFVAKTNPLILLDLGGNVFENASVDTNILLFAKDKNAGSTRCATYSRYGENSFEKLSDFVQQNGTHCQFSGNDNWVIQSAIEQSIKLKIESTGLSLKKRGINIYRGVVTGCNEAFIISSERRDSILSNCLSREEQERTADIIKPILRGRDIKRYSYKWDSLWIIYIPWHFPLHLDSSIQGASEKAEALFSKQYPSLYQYMLSHKDTLSKRNKSETGIRYEWYALQRWGPNYWKEFYHPKIVWASVGETYYSLIPSNMYLLDTNYFFAIDAPSYLLGVLNSKLIKYWINGEDTPLGTGAYRHYKYNIERICVPEVSTELVELVDNLLKELKNNSGNMTLIDKKIDNLVYQLYNLTPEEIEVIEKGN